MHILLLDNYDSFTYNLYDYLLRLGATCQVVRNDQMPAHELAALNFDAVVLSPGPRQPADAGCLMEFVQIAHNQWPMLGVCLGHQAIGQFFGAKLSLDAQPLHGKIRPAHHDNSDIFAGLPNPLPVMRYHSLILQNLPDCLPPLAHSADGEVMALRHRDLPIWGVQFHPESIGTPQGLQLLQNWLNFVKQTP